MKAYVADFETTDEDDHTKTRVWAYAICSIADCNKIEYGIDIAQFILWCTQHTGSRIYFHNLDFDGNFIMNYLLKSGWLWVDSDEEAEQCSFTALIGEVNQIYSIKIFLTPKKFVEIYDSLKVIQLKVEKIPKAFGLDQHKGIIDYKAYRPVGHQLTDEEKEYIKGDVQIVAQAMKIMLSQSMSRMTAASNALASYKKMKSKQAFDMLFPVLDDETDKFIRRAYRGGFTYVSPKFQGRILKEGIVLDVNSLYPSVMHCVSGERIPYEYPARFEGEPPFLDLGAETDYLWVAEVDCMFSLKKDHIPCIQLKGNSRFVQTEYLAESRGMVNFVTTNVDWALITQQYDVSNVTWHGGYMMLSKRDLFNGFIDENMRIKAQATIEGNKGMRSIAKLRMNSLYGKFGTRPQAKRRKPTLNEHGAVRFVDCAEDDRDSIYIPVAVFVTAWARYKTITSAQQCYDRFIYADTDSLHLIGTDIPENLEVDDVKLGAWKHESTFSHAKFLRAKCYVEEDPDSKELTVHVAGMPDRCHSQVTLQNFVYGAVYHGKLYRHNVDGGVVLVDGDIEIRDR